MVYWHVEGSIDFASSRPRQISKKLSMMGADPKGDLQFYNTVKGAKLLIGKLGILHTTTKL